MAINNSSDTRINSRSPYYIEAGRAAPAEVTIPPDTEDNIPPTVIIQASNETPTIGQTVTLTAVATDSDGYILGYLWGGGQTTSEITATSEDAISITYYVTVTDDDGDTGSDSITIHWQLPAVDTNPFVSVDCGDTYNEVSFIGTKTYRLLVGDKIGDVTIALREPYYTSYDVAVKFDLDWNGTTASTGYVGLEGYHDSTDPEDYTATPSSKSEGTTVTVQKTAATPDYATLTATVSTAQDIIPNDTYTFELICPDVTTPTTFYYTLTNDCSTGDSTITYLDVNGVTQTVTLAQGESQVVSAREDSIIETVCDTTIDKGDESFDLGKPDLEINNDYAFTFITDSSSSFTINRRPIQDMLSNELRDTMLQYYNNSQADYDSKFLATGGSERMYEAASIVGARNEKSVVCVMWNEGNPRYHRDGGALNGYMYKGDDHDTDVLAVRNMLDGGTAYGDKILILFNFKDPSAGGDYKYTAFQTYLDKIENGGYDTLDGTQSFYGDKGFSDRSDVIFVNNVLNGQSSQYYHDLVVQTLRDNGFQI